MAFGDKAKQYADQQQDSSGERTVYESAWMPLGPGTTLFWWLPKMDGDQPVKTERKSPQGKPLREGNKKDGAILMGLEPEEEVDFLYVWWEVMVGGELKNRPLMLDPMRKFNNPLWKHIDKHWPKDKEAKQQPKQRNSLRHQFAANVLDVTPVQLNKDGEIFYPAEDGTWRKLAQGNNGKVLDPKKDKDRLPEAWDNLDAAREGIAVPLNKVRILQGSYGEIPGKHYFDQVYNLARTSEDSEGVIHTIAEHVLRNITTGIELKTNRTLSLGPGNFGQPAEAFLNLARYDLATWSKPWPDEAIERLINMEDYGTIVEEYKLETYPKKFATEGETEEDTEGSEFD